MCDGKIRHVRIRDILYVLDSGHGIFSIAGIEKHSSCFCCSSLGHLALMQPQIDAEGLCKSIFISLDCV